MLSVSKLIYWLRFGETDVVNFDSFGHRKFFSENLQFLARVDDNRNQWDACRFTRVKTMNHRYIN